MNDHERPIGIDLFSGAGGLSLGFEQAGFDIAAAVEIDPIHAAIHELNFPHTKVICRSVADLSGDDIREHAKIGRRAIDVVFGGPPCQGFSLIGHRILEDPRNSLVMHFLRLVRELRPRTFVMENVPGMLTGGHTQVLDELVAGFRAAGYRVRMPVETRNAAHFGVPQDRRRLFVLGARGDARLPEYPSPTTRFTPNGTRELALHFLRACPTVEDAIGDLPNIEEFDSLVKDDVLRVRLRGGSTYARRLRGEVDDPEDYSYPRVHDGARLTGCLRAAHTALSRRRFRATAPGTTEPISRFFKLAADGVCNTLRAGTNRDRGAFSAPRPIHYEHARCISVREAARLHSFPDWFRFHRTIWHGFRQIGNAVPPLLARAIASQVMRALDAKPARPREALTPGDERLAGFSMRAAAAHFDVPDTVIDRRVRGADAFAAATR